jgi:hypothetical protein
MTTTNISSLFAYSRHLSSVFKVLVLVLFCQAQMAQTQSQDSTDLVYKLYVADYGRSGYSDDLSYWAPKCDVYIEVYEHNDSFDLDQIDVCRKAEGQTLTYVAPHLISPIFLSLHLIRDN